MFYDYSVLDAKDNEVKMSDFKGKVVIVVNTATGCGFTPQYDPAENDGITFEDLPDEWKCPRCRQGKDKFNPA